ncbi:hypothetical protein RHGRI_000997 [Rhododendron griersonianum]|uniref:BRCT domain-containing protein n=1 Tax=Rhododendron griersonianum TaxID=479676 RepID=A0AAV6LJS6_9ERIC|nr:hypothetical protein RHGRI_000997 [Rhododendron griersonianum]
MTVQRRNRSGSIGMMTNLVENFSKSKGDSGRNEHPKKAPPSFYAVTNNSKERPDVWIDNPEKSIILSITSDIRTIRSEVFAAPYSLRYPRIDRVRYDKPWHEYLDVQSFIELVDSSNGTTKRGADCGEVQNNKPRGMKLSRKGEKKRVSVVSPRFIQTDVSYITEATLIFSDMVFYFVNVPPTHSLDSLHKMVAENGGTFSMNLNNSVSNCIASECKGIKFEAAKLCGDIIHYSWLLDCHSQKKLLTLQPKYFLFLSDSSRKKLQQELDENLTLTTRISTLKTSNRNSDSKVLDELAVRRMKLEISMCGGKISKSLSQATHLVVISPLGFNMDFSTILRGYATSPHMMKLRMSLLSSEVNVIPERTLHVVGSQWLEDCFNKGQKLQEERYSLKPTSLEESRFGEWKQDPSQCDSSYMDNGEQQNMSSPPTNDGKQRKGKASSRLSSSPWKDEIRERGRPTITSGHKRKISVIQPQRPRGHPRKSATVHENESDVNPFSKKNGIAEESEMEIGDNRSPTVEDSGLSEERRIVNPHAVGEDSERGEWVGKAQGIESASGSKVHDCEKLEVMVGPAQSMLTNMIPSIGTMKVDGIATAVEEGKQPEDNKEDSVKKKKRVSYKDVAGELLRDG